jgi:hypothetical protein
MEAKKMEKVLKFSEYPLELPKFQKIENGDPKFKQNSCDMFKIL